MTAESLRDLAALRAKVAVWKNAGDVVGLVATMGALHQGHLSLAKYAREHCDRVIVTIFVNPRQFNNAEDLAKYPRTEQADAALLEPAGVDVIFLPDATDVYPQGFATTVSVAGLSAGLCGDYRPGHFDGVATVVTKLLLMSGAERAFFGEKDYQQLMVVRALARDLNIAVEIIGCPTIREPDGLAMSSRNRRIVPSDRPKAAALNAAMRQAAREITAGKPVATSLMKARKAIIAAGFGEVEYVELRSAEDLSPMPVLDRPARLLAAGRLGEVRLIDNIAVGQAAA